MAMKALSSDENFVSTHFTKSFQMSLTRAKYEA